MVFRTANMCLDTLRVLAVMRSKKAAAWIYGFFQVLIYLFLISWVLADLHNPLKVFGFCAGFATGNALGMWLEERFAGGYTDLQIVSSRRGLCVAQSLRALGFAVTETGGGGRDGTVTVLTCSVRRKSVLETTEVIRGEDPDAFITSSEVRLICGGFWG
jgi:uncharacterized protein YebE (UPF0316 family)